MPDYTLAVSVNAGNGYRIAPNTSRDTLLVQDDDYHTIGLIMDTSVVVEGEAIHYRIAVVPDTLMSDLTVSYQLERVDEFGNVSESIPLLGVIEPDRDSTNYTITTSRNYQQDGHFHYLVRLLPGNGYRVDPAYATGTVQILDADSPIGFSIEAVNQYTSIDLSSNCFTQFKPMKQFQL